MDHKEVRPIHYQRVNKLANSFMQNSRKYVWGFEGVGVMWKEHKTEFIDMVPLNGGFRFNMEVCSVKRGVKNFV